MKQIYSQNGSCIWARTFNIVWPWKLTEFDNCVARFRELKKIAAKWKDHIIFIEF